MTENEWLTCDDLNCMTDFMGGRVSERKLILFGCACCYRHWAIIPDGCCKIAVETAERFADRGCDATELRRAREQVKQEHPNLFWYQEYGCHAEAATYFAAFDTIAAREMELEHPLGRPGNYLTVLKCHEVAYGIASAVTRSIREDDRTETEWKREEAVQCALFRHIIGNPFRPYPAPPSWPSPVVKLAEALYAGENCSFALHDALLEAGHPELAEHFREKEHPKGCWAVDMILEKS